jgi:L-lactate dehydrogenase complex protein LldG
MAREDILRKLRQALQPQPPFSAAQTNITSTLPVTHIGADENLSLRFAGEVERVKGVLHRAEDDPHALQVLLAVLAEHTVTRYTSWDADALPFDPHSTLSQRGLTRIQGDNAAVETAQAGITGCDAAIAATGTLVLRSGPGRSRMASLLPPLHIALVHTSQLLPRLEDWVATQTAAGLDEIRAASNVTLIIGCSRTADIEMSPVFGVHGPLAFHVILIGA